jgi:hypothetical protein
MKIARSLSGIWFIKFNEVEVTTRRELDIWHEAVRRGVTMGLITGVCLSASVAILIWIIRRLIS